MNSIRRTSALGICAMMMVSVVACSDKPADTTDTVAGNTLSANPGPAPAAPYVYATDYGIGDLRAGMTLDEATRAVPDISIIAGTDSVACSYLNWPSAPAGVLVMFDGGRVARVDIDSVGVRTEAGAQVGDSEARIDSLYAGRVTTMPHKYTDGHYKVVKPMRAADSLFRTIFEAEGGKVTRYRVGKLPQVEYVEGCS